MTSCFPAQTPVLLISSGHGAVLFSGAIHVDAPNHHAVPVRSGAAGTLRVHRLAAADIGRARVQNDSPESFRLIYNPNRNR